MISHLGARPAGVAGRPRAHRCSTLDARMKLPRYRTGDAALDEEVAALVDGSATRPTPT